MGYIYYDNLITFSLLIISAITVFYAQYKINTTYQKYSTIKNKKKLSGQEVARAILDSNNLENVYIVKTKGKLTDHYDPNRKVIRLSKEVFDGDDISSLAIAAHEVGHAIQDKENYVFMKIRYMLIPFINMVNYAGYFAILIGILAGITGYLLIGILTIVATLIFQLITLPIEKDASIRALENLKKLDLYEDGTDLVLKAAEFTYIASVISSLLNLIRLILIFKNDD